MPTGLLRLMLRRAVSEKLFVALRFVGLTLAIAIASGVFIFLDALGQSALNQRLNRADPSELNIGIRGRTTDATASAQEQLMSDVTSSIGASIGSVTDEPTMAAKSPTLQFNPNQVAWKNARAFIATSNKLEAASAIVSGEWPTEGRDPLEVALSESDAAYLGVQPGDRLEVFAPSGDASRFNVQISGVFTRTDSENAMWHAIDVGLGAQSEAFRITPLMVNGKSMADDFPQLMPDSEVRFYWVLSVDPNLVKARNVDALLSELDSQDAILRQHILGYQRITDLDRLLADHASRASLSVGLMLAVGLVLAVASLSFAALVSSRATELRETESGTMRARGSNARQEMLLMVGENITVAAFALIAGPGLALVVVTFAGYLPPLDTLTDSSSLPATLTIESVGTAVAVCALGVGVMVLPVLTRSTQHVFQRLARPPQLTLIQRYYLDLPIFGLALVAMWQLGRGEFRLATDILGSGFNEQLVLAMPAALALGGALIVLRFMPLATSLLGEAASRIQTLARMSPAVTLSLWTLARNPRSNFGLMLLVILAVSIATLVAILGPSLESHSAESARYLVGADARVSNMIVRSQSTLAREVESVRGIEGIGEISPATRALGTVAVPTGTEAITVLGVDTDTFASVLNWRDDFGDLTATEMTSELRSDRPTGIPVPQDTVMLTALVKPDLRRADVGLTVRLRGASGRYYSLTIGNLAPRSVTMRAMEMFPCEDVGLSDDGEPLAPQEWCRIGAPLTAAQLDDGELSNMTLEFIGISRRPAEEPLQLGVGAVAIADISAMKSDGSLHELTNWRNITQERTPGGGFGDLGARIDPISATGAGGAILTWSQPAWRELKGVVIGDNTPVVNVIGGRWFRDVVGLGIGERVRVYLGSRDVDVVFRGFADYFPTFGFGQSPYVIADLQRVRDILVIDDPTSADSINELWFNLESDDPAILDRVDALLSQALSAQPRIQDASSERSRFVADPLASLGWNSFLTFGLISIVAITVLAFTLNGWTAYRLRSLELAVLRSLGLTQRQWMLLICLEQTVPPLVAAAIGSGVGLALSAVLLPYMAGQDIETLAPPMLVSIGWRMFGIACGLIAVGLAVSIGSVMIWTRHQQINSVLRAGGGIG